MVMTSLPSAPSASWIGVNQCLRGPILTKGGRLGPGAADAKEASCLNRIVRWCDAGLEYEADPRQAEKLIEELQFNDGVNSCVTPGVKVGLSQIEEDKPLNPERHTIFRALAARANYLAADRPDCTHPLSPRSGLAPYKAHRPASPALL